MFISKIRNIDLDQNDSIKASIDISFDGVQSVEKIKNCTKIDDFFIWIFKHLNSETQKKILMKIERKI